MLENTFAIQVPGCSVQ